MYKHIHKLNADDFTRGLALTLKCANIRKDWFNGSMLMDSMMAWLSLFKAQTCEMNAPCSNAHDLIRSISFYIALCANLR